MYTAFKNSDGICISPNLYDSSTNLDQTFAFVQNTSSHCTEVRFSSLLSGGFITAIVVNPMESKLAKCTSVQCLKHPLQCEFKKRCLRHNYVMKLPRI